MLITACLACCWAVPAALWALQAVIGIAPAVISCIRIWRVQHCLLQSVQRCMACSYSVVRCLTAVHLAGAARSSCCCWCILTEQVVGQRLVRCCFGWHWARLCCALLSYWQSGTQRTNHAHVFVPRLDCSCLRPAGFCTYCSF